MITSRAFPSKVLLFGEYSVIKHSKALAIPFQDFKGELSFREGSFVLDRELKSFFLYLKTRSKRGLLSTAIDLDLFEKDLALGLCFNSTIPQGYGLGSSGALCAAVYERYAKNKRENLEELKFALSQLESHFHGESSGIDPLVSYMNSALVLAGKDKIERVDISVPSEKNGAIFLLDSGMPRRTGALVKLFLEKTKEERFARLTDEVLIPLTNSCVEAFLQHKRENLFEFFRALSDFQFRHFSPMIPEIIHDFWQQGIQSELFYLKLCGAGGGGFFLGITLDYEKTVEACESFSLLPVFKF